VLVVLFVVVAALQLGGMRRPKPLEMMTVVCWAPSECAADASWVAEWNYGDGWKPALLGGHVLEPGECTAFLRGLTLGWRACCVRGEERACDEAEVAPPSVPCSAIYNLSGAAFSSEEVAEWNDEHYSPTPTPSPPPSAGVLSDAQVNTL
jgi:hypothetical protein